MYVDGFVLPLPSGKTETYRKIAQGAGEVWMDHGALAYRECLLDPTDKPNDFCTTFPQAFQPQAGETIIFAYILYRDKAHRDEVNAKVMADDRMKPENMPTDMPFDCKRMAYNGFTTLVDLGSNQ